MKTKFETVSKVRAVMSVARLNSYYYYKERNHM